jgi:exonuclease SbcC
MNEITTNKGIRIKAIKISNYVGIDEFQLNPGTITVIEGPKGEGKTSVLEAIHTAVENKKSRTEVIRHGADEATLFIEMDNGLEINRKLRAEGSDYFKLRNGEQAIKSTESELRKLLSGEIFRPLDFIELDPKEQAVIILNMIKMNYGPSDINEWFGEDVLSGINTDKHLLQQLKDIENKFFAERTEVKKVIGTLETQVRGIEKGLPDNYDGKAWEELKLQDYYDKVAKAKTVNDWIEKSVELKSKFDENIETINATGANRKKTIKFKYKDLASDINDMVEIVGGKIEKAQVSIDNSENVLTSMLQTLENEYQKELLEIQKKFDEKKAEAKKETFDYNVELKEFITLQDQKISNKQVELANLDEKKQLELDAVDQEILSDIEKAKLSILNADAYLENNEKVDLEPLQAEADKVAQMQGYLREWDRMVQIRDGRMAEKQKHVNHLTVLIETARNKPSELLKQHELPIDGIGVDDNSMIRINGTLLDGLSSGEKLEAAFKIALQRIGDLRILCLDGLEKLNRTEQEKVVKLCEDENIQAFVTITTEIPGGNMVVNNHLPTEEELKNRKEQLKIEKEEQLKLNI